MSLTKGEIEDTQVIVVTPEKWDIITRKSGASRGGGNTAAWWREGCAGLPARHPSRLQHTCSALWPSCTAPCSAASLL